MRCVRALLAGTLLGMALPAGAADVFEHPADPVQLYRDLSASVAELRKWPRLEGRFTQRKHLDGFPAPLVSGGSFVFLRGGGVVWQTTDPFHAELTLSATGIREQGRSIVEEGSGAEQAMRLVSGIFLSVFDLDLEVLEERFALYAMPHADGWEQGWTIGLRPRDAAVAVIAESICLHGQRLVERIELRDTRGDRTEVLFHDVQGSPAEMTAEERARFE